MVYPYWTKDDSLRKKLIDNRVFVATYWPKVMEWCKVDDWEYTLTTSLIPLPVDHRLGTYSLSKIVEISKLGKSR